MEKYSNDLIHETSPYLLQHAHNPVNWVAWSGEVFERAKAEDKLVLISIGYSSCHWCHVMEHECFEDEEVAALMNKFFINVKVDREERPDVDQVYMTAVQLMTQRGGWPLNCFTLPDGSPVYGGTYFPKEQWMHILRSLHHTYTNEREKVQEYAADLARGVNASELITAPKEGKVFEESHLEELVRRWSKSFDREHGGKSHAPKFPLPNNLEFLLEYALQTGDESVRSYVELTLDRMAMGGIYDQVGGGFARYSVDMLWKVPHFEKMAYDNGQLLSIYARAYTIFGKALYRNVILDTVAWPEREMADGSGAFYAALDADSEGEEGKFYIWKKEELLKILGDEYPWVADYYSVDQRGYWEHDNYILLRRSDDATICKRYGWSVAELEARRKKVNGLLLDARSERIRPGLDDKCLTSWNAMVLKGLSDASVALEDPHLLDLARRNAHWLLTRQLRADASLWRTYKEGRSTIDGFLEDYAHAIAAFIALYQASLEESHLFTARRLLEYVLNEFSDDASGMFFFTRSDSGLIARKMELNDNVIPASNSVMARNLYYLGRYFHESSWTERARQMLANVYDGMEMYGSAYSNWGILLIHELFGLYEFVVTGESEEAVHQMRSAKIPQVLIAANAGESKLPIFDEKEVRSDGTTLIHVCTSGTCFRPTTDVTEALAEVIQ